MREAITQFHAAILAAGLTPPDPILADGLLHRFASNGKRGDDAGWYVLHADEIAAGSFGCWRTGLSQTWRADIGRRLSAAEEAAHRARQEAQRREREADAIQRREEAQTTTANLLAESTPCSEHPYLARKQIQAHGARRYKDALLIPMRAEGVLHSLQFIDADGSKRFLAGGRVTGCYFSIGQPKGAAALCICEGFATGASLHEATGLPVAVAFNAGNLVAVAKAMRAKFAALPLILCADDDYSTEGNPGLSKAREAAQTVGGLLAMPKFGADRPEGATDFNDMAILCGSDAVKRILNDTLTDMPLTEAPARTLAGERRVGLVRASDITPEPVAWLWNGWLAQGKMHVLGGAPGTGKTTIALALAATVTTGGRWPDGSRATSGNVVIWSGEDDPADTLIPRLALSGADRSRVYFIADVMEGGERRAFDPARDMEPLRHRLAEIGDVRLLIVDPIVSAIAGDSHKNAEVRRSLQPLVDLAGALRCALLGITHFSKGTGGRDPVERLTGSLAFGALARVVLVAAKQQEEGEDGHTVRLFLRAKSNIGPDEGGFEYGLQQGELKEFPGVFTSAVAWGDAVEGAARELLASADTANDDGEGGSLADAKRFLADLLADGPVPTKAIKADADGAGHSWTTLKRAKKDLGVEAIKDGMKSGWRWHLPGRGSKKSEEAQHKGLNPFVNSEPLHCQPMAFEAEI